MPDSPRDEVARRRSLRENTLRGQSQYQRVKRKTDVGGNIPLERSLPQHRCLPFNLEDEIEDIFGAIEEEPELDPRQK